MYRFFVEPKNIIDGEKVLIVGSDVQHITRSLRLKSEDQVTICDGQGIDYLVKLEELSSDEVTCEIINSYPSYSEPKIQVTLFQGLPKSDKMDLIIQKSTELGIHQIIPIETSRTIVKFNEKKANNRIIRWQKIAESAAKQSNRGKIPQIGNILRWKEFINILKEEKYDLIFVPWENAEDKSLRKLLRQVDGKKTFHKIAYFIGPEGGISDEEIETLIALGVKPVTLGSRILRTETAGFVALTVLMYEFLEMEGGDRHE